MQKNKTSLRDNKNRHKNAVKDIENIPIRDYGGSQSGASTQDITAFSYEAFARCAPINSAKAIASNAKQKNPSVRERRNAVYSSSLRNLSCSRSPDYKFRQSYRLRDGKHSRFGARKKLSFPHYAPYCTIPQIESCH